MAFIFPHRRAGFTLIELAITLMVLSFMIAGILTVATQESRRAKQAGLKMKMDAIEEALINFARRNARISCPASYTLAINNADFGKEGGAGGSSSCTAAIATGIKNDGQKLYYGAVPVRSLGLPDDYMFDPWGGRFTYAVDQTAIVFTTQFYSSTLVDNLGSLEIRNTAGNTVETGVIAVLLSHGPNGHGAFQLNGQRKSSLSTNANELRNCKCDSVAPPNDVSNGTIYIRDVPTSSPGNPLDVFDDTVRLFKRSKFLSPQEMQTE